MNAKVLQGFDDDKKVEEHCAKPSYRLSDFYDNQSCPQKN